MIFRLPCARLPSSRALLGLLLLSFVLRFGLAMLYPGVAFPDEVFQYQEPAHRWLTGRGVATWEWAEHIRSWFIPLLVLPVMAGARLVSTSPIVYRAAIDAAVTIASLPIVAVAYGWGHEVGAPASEEDGKAAGRSALVAGFLAAVWFQWVYFGAHLLADTLAADMLLPALYAVRRYRLAGGRGFLVLGAALLGIVCYMRPQLAPAMLLPAGAAFVAARRRGDGLLCLAAGLGPFLALGALDWVTLGTPFQSIWLYAYVNLRDVTGEFGDLPWYWYFGNTMLDWSGAAIVILFFAAKMARRFTVEFVTACLIVAIMSLIAHKESRFILPAQTIFLVLGGVGMGAALPRARWALPTLLGIIALVSLVLATGPFLRTIRRWHAPVVALDRIMADPRACGVYFLKSLVPDPLDHTAGYANARYFNELLSSNGYSYARDGVRLYADPTPNPATDEAAANYIVTLLKRGQYTRPIPVAYRLEGCALDISTYIVCTYHRPGDCS